MNPSGPLARRRTAHSVMIAVALLVMSLSAQAATLQVPASYATIQAAVDAASSGDTIQVAAGTYRENVVWSTKTLQLIGAGAGQSIISGDTNDDGTPDGVCLSLTSVPAGSRIEGFTITKGTRGINLAGSSPTITQNIISDNAPTGGIASASPSLPTISFNTFTGNTGGSGGGVLCSSGNATTIITGNVFANNTANSGGGVACTTGASPTISNNVFTGNTGNWYGGAIDCFNFCSPAISGNIIQNNTTPSMGGAMRLYRGAATLTNNLITGNQGNYGGAIYADSAQPSLNLNTIAGNSATTYGGGISASQCTLSISNTILAFNTSPTGGGLRASGGTITFSYSNVFGNAPANFSVGFTDPTGTNGNIGVDPLFVNAGSGDYHLQSQAGHWTSGGWMIDAQNSPCIDAGNPATAYALEPSPNGSRVNMGAYGNTGEASRTSDGQTPSVSGVTISPAPGGGLEAITGVWSDPNGDAEGYNFQWAKWNGTAWQNLAGETEATLAASNYVRGDQVRVTCWPTDGTNVGSPVTDEYTVPNDVPWIGSVAITPDPPRAGDTLELVLGAWNDADGDPEGYIYQWSHWVGPNEFDFEDIAGATGPTLAPENFSRGDRVAVEVIPFDGIDQGMGVVDEVTIANGLPSAASVTISPDPATAADNLLATPSGWSDTDGDAEAYDWQWEVDSGTGFAVVAGADTDTLAASNFARGDQVRVTCTPNDGTDTGTAVTDTITISNAVPSVAAVLIQPDPATASDDLTAVTGVWSDADGDAEAYDWQWEVDSGTGFAVVAGADTDTLAASNFARGDQVRVACTPNDGTDTGTAVTDTITISNAVPSVAAVLIQPDPATASDDLTAVTGVWSDADGDAEAYDWQWEVDSGTGFAVIAGANTDTLASGNFATGNAVRVTATPNDGIATGTPVSDTITIEQQLYTLDIAYAAAGTVTVNGTPQTLPYSGQFAEGTVVTIDAIPIADWQFQVWSGDVTQANKLNDPLVLTMGQDYSIRAHFQAIKRQLTIGWASAGTVLINGTPQSLPYTGLFPINSTVNVQTVPIAGWELQKWTGDVAVANSTDDPLAITMDQDRSIRPYFWRVRRTLTIDWAGAGTVMVNGVAQVLPYTGTFPNGTVVSIEPLPIDAWKFHRWTGELPTTDAFANPLALTMDQDRAIKPWFERIKRTLTIDWAGAGTVTVNGTPQTLPYTGAFPINSAVTVVAVPKPGYIFDQWGGEYPAGGRFSETIELTMDADRTVRPYFKSDGQAAAAQLMGVSAHATGAGAEISFTLSAPASVSAEVLNIAGRTVRQIVVDREYQSGPQSLAWNGVSEHGTRVPSGTYLVRVSAFGEGGERCERISTVQMR